MQALRTALNVGLHLENAHAIIRECDDLLKNGDLVNPIAVFSIRAVAAHVAERDAAVVGSGK